MTSVLFIYEHDFIIWQPGVEVSRFSVASVFFNKINNLWTPDRFINEIESITPNVNTADFEMINFFKVFLCVLIL